VEKFRKTSIDDVIVADIVPATSGSCSCHEHTTNLATAVSQQPVLDCGMTFHPGYGGLNSPSIPSDDL